MLFVISLVLFIVCCVVVLFLMKKFTNIMVTNLIFDTSFFGLSFVIFFVGSVGVLTLGYFFQQLWTKPKPPVSQAQ